MLYFFFKSHRTRPCSRIAYTKRRSSLCFGLATARANGINIYVTGMGWLEKITNKKRNRYACISPTRSTPSHGRPGRPTGVLVYRKTTSVILTLPRYKKHGKCTVEKPSVFGIYSVYGIRQRS